MKNYTFLIKPFFFIFSLIFSTWLVLAIEKIRPSDFGQIKTLFEKEIKQPKISKTDKQYLKDLFSQYKLGSIDSATFDKRLESFVISIQSPLIIKK
ncbi:MAG: hypothetical protein V4608_02340 [Bacteroidota bacterium]